MTSVCLSVPVWAIAANFAAEQQTLLLPPGQQEILIDRCVEHSSSMGECG